MTDGELSVDGKVSVVSSGFTYLDLTAGSASTDPVVRLYNDNGDVWANHMDSSVSDKWQLRYNGSTKLTLTVDGDLDCNSVMVDELLTLTPTTVAGAPTGSAGDVIYVSDGDAGSPCLGVHNGTDWKVVSLGATISAT